MSIEDELFRMFQYVNVSGSGAKNIDVNKMLTVILRNMQTDALRKLRQRIDVMIASGEGDKSAWTTEEPRSGGTGGTSPGGRSFGGTNFEDLNPFTILGVDMNASKEEVDKAYREKAKTAHPDKGGSDEEMVKVNAAKEVIYLFKGWKKE